MTINAQNIIDKALIGEDFMELMGEYQDRQHHDPDFDVNAGLYDLYVDLSKPLQPLQR